ncbi:MAG TPA: hypothetical protein VHE13_03305 [Opitutus sp.]|nr:hypothetical protein [Opitutus sp.]
MVEVRTSVCVGKMICGLDGHGQIAAMSLAEIQSQVKALPPSERVVLSAYLRHLGRRDSAANQQSLDAAAARIEAGEKVSRAQLVRLHETLKAGGL